MISGFRAVRAVLFFAVLVVLVEGCSNTFRPTIVSVPGNSGDPSSLAQAVVLSTNPGGGPGSDTHIDVSGDTNVGVVNLGTNPVFLSKISNNRALAINSDQTVTSYLALLPQSTAINVITQPSGSLTGVSAAASSNGNIYVANNGSNNVTVIPGNQNVATGNVTVGSQPVSVASNAASNKAYVVNRGSNNVSVINAQDNSVAAAVIPVDTSPIWGLVSTDGRLLFVVNQGSGTVTVIDTVLDMPVASPPITVGSMPNFAFYDNKLKRVYVNNSGSNSISVIKADVFDPANSIFPTLLATINLSPGPLPTSLTVLADGSRAYVARGGCAAGINHISLPASLAGCTGNLVSVIDAVGLREMGTVTVGSGAVSIDASSDSSKV
ncbi:MAG TPA: YncE family protein, partial [Candidatus Saccharimonadales bacterium]|nr:YncE family protein [Candidatus Saccharimonadales bacterium]